MSTPRQAHGKVLARGAARPAAALLVALAALLTFGVGSASADPWVSIGARATPYSAGSTQGWGVPLLYGDDHACAAGRVRDERLPDAALKAEVAIGDGKGGWNVVRGSVLAHRPRAARRRRHRLPLLRHVPAQERAPQVRRLRLGGLQRHPRRRLPRLQDLLLHGADQAEREAAAGGPTCPPT